MKNKEGLENLGFNSQVLWRDMRDPISIDKYTGLFKIADSLDEFIDKLYIEKTENRVVNIAQGRKVLKEMDEYIKERGE